MYSEEDINSAVAAGALSEDAAAAFRAHMSEVRGISRGDEENFRLLNSFNDIFVAIGIAIMLFAAGAIGQQIGKLIVPVQAWDWSVEASEAAWAAYQQQSSLSTAVSIAIAAGLVALTAWPVRLKPASSGSTAGSSVTCAHPLVAASSQVLAVKVVCTPWSSTPK